ncbi:CGNR zinc finger domain-containing protein [Amycolatopsis sp. PS_44_ISF1]|uniref:CGNR zinc finger domain-containing protein n=1 Tax=Amycolatopsis sp. PS_44_ISF1 TaxID=2974917 RepID=UPI0028DD4243|nr:CGNR zinc finger domain-containing protein [Amycolatopsis sp. PS_44_ISF1]MDT8909958.1 CGNR zinc finger domain-containing protein [Amycolatopsis sp. PS_44_ISF1]
MHPDASLVVAFLNTVDVERNEDRLDDPEQWRRWSAEHDLGPGDPADARAARDALRAAIGDPGLPPRPLDAPLHFTLTADGPTLATPDAISAILAAVTRLTIRGDWVRLKICPADDCLWAFYDESRNRSRTWCSMRACGNREKARAWRARAAGGHPQHPVDN